MPGPAPPDYTFRGHTQAPLYLLVLLESNRASGFMLPTARLPVFQAVIAQWPCYPTIRLQVLSRGYLPQSGLLTRLGWPLRMEDVL